MCKSNLYYDGKLEYVNIARNCLYMKNAVNLFLYGPLLVPLHELKFLL
jgi:hypothetical protein